MVTEALSMSSHENTNVFSNALYIILSVMHRILYAMLYPHNGTRFVTWINLVVIDTLTLFGCLLLHLIPTFMWGRCTMTYASM